MKAGCTIDTEGGVRIIVYPETDAETEILRLFKEKIDADYILTAEDNLERAGYSHWGDNKIVFSWKKAQHE